MLVKQVFTSNKVAGKKAFSSLIFVWNLFWIPSFWIRMDNMNMLKGCILSTTSILVLQLTSSDIL